MKLELGETESLRCGYWVDIYDYIVGKMLYWAVTVNIECDVTARVLSSSAGMAFCGTLLRFN